jgi:hypothetical protein
MPYDWLWDSITQHLVGLWLLAEIFWPFFIICPIVRLLLDRQISQDSFDRNRFNGFVRILTFVMYIVLEAAFLNIQMNVNNLVHWIAVISIFVIVWRFPEQIPNLSIFPEGLAQPILSKLKPVLSRLKRLILPKLERFSSRLKWPWMPRGFPVQLVRGDQLKSLIARQRIGIMGDVFRCFICKKQKGYPEEYGATLFIKRKKSHVCADCVQAAPQLKVEDIRRWM